MPEHLDTRIGIVNIGEKPELKGQAAEWFHSKWGVPVQEYLRSMELGISGGAAVPRWYVALARGRIIGGIGVIENDFHQRRDLRPNVCALYVEPEYRTLGIAGRLLGRVCGDMAAEGIRTLYLITDHTSFYERYGWEFFCMVQGEGEEILSRMYVHRV